MKHETMERQDQGLGGWPAVGEAKRHSLPGVIYAIRQDGREVSYRYEDGLIYCTGSSKQMKPYRPGFGRLTASPSLC